MGSLKNYDINASSLGINASGAPRCSGNKSNVTEAGASGFTRSFDIENLSREP